VATLVEQKHGPRNPHQTAFLQTSRSGYSNCGTWPRGRSARSTNCALMAWTSAPAVFECLPPPRHRNARQAAAASWAPRPREDHRLL